MFDPSRLRQCLAQRAVSVAARVKYLALVTAFFTHVEPPAQNRSSAGCNVARHFPLRLRHRVLLAIFAKVGAENVTHRRACCAMPSNGHRRRLNGQLLKGFAGLRTQDIKRARHRRDVGGADLRVPRRRANRRVPKQHLNDANVVARLEQVRREGMSK